MIVHEQACLLTPGPLALSRAVKEAMLFDVGSRDAYFKDITQEIRAWILALAGGVGSHAVIPIQGSGTFAVEAALTTFIGPQDKALVLINGLYGERIATILRRNGLACEAMVIPVTQPPDVEQVAARLDADPSITHLCFVHCETTSGILNPFRALIRCARARGVITVVDSMSAFGAIPVNAQEDGFDILVSSGNKCIEAPPGLAFAVVATPLLTRKSARAHSFCLDLYDQWRSFEEIGEWRSTPPTHVVLALHRALSELLAEGIDQRRARYERVRRRLVDGLRPLGFEPILSPELQSPICVAFRTDHWDGNDQAGFQRLYDHLAADRIYVYAKVHAPTRSFRIGCIGQIQEAWIDRLIDRVADFVVSSPSCRSPAEPGFRSLQTLAGAA